MWKSALTEEWIQRAASIALGWLAWNSIKGKISLPKNAYFLNIPFLRLWLHDKFVYKENCNAVINHMWRKFTIDNDQNVINRTLMVGASPVWLPSPPGTPWGETRGGRGVLRLLKKSNFPLFLGFRIKKKGWFNLRMKLIKGWRLNSFHFVSRVFVPTPSEVTLSAFANLPKLKLIKLTNDRDGSTYLIHAEIQGQWW